ncbi:5-formyltetrahydrofolate cyclo-ligase [Streptococcus dysgalactiae subsp. equisimilis]|uniref:5-formyltetrahydrofolate cyclo-ligase n=2 Tax=Streptococcus dysgalactiae TaxID=1334 RepID=A0A9X9SI03_STRDY|nr:5-formyltetrahydrofolate cyclo-ligase [Streptococcus dysgalactiae subsp. equisimilis]VTS50742.1 5-formyltetrahydrofolate cyclo-ligase [Streptococcus dysgalactiae subsp. equisimilis]VTS78577.1 5-formyltetrahydrofolate cyclo-ligase [Streptococcus dysgalactiae]
MLDRKRTLNLFLTLCYDRGMIKKDIRQEVLQALRTMPPTLKQQKDKALLEDVVNSSAYQEAKVIATYLSLPTEYQTDGFIQRAISDGKTVVVPKMLGKGNMIFVAYQADDLAVSSFGILEPRSQEEIPKSAIDCLHVPGVGFNEQGFRIGYGGGYYDRYLQDYDGPTFSTIYDCQMKAFVPESHDIAVQEVYRR